MSKIIVTGAGLGGMAAAIRLAHAGAEVEIWEKNETAGGKLQELKWEGYRWDTGPSLLTMPEVLKNLFSEVGEKIEDYLELAPLDSTCRYFWSDGTIIDEDAAFWQRNDVARFMKYARGIYELSGEAFLNYAPDEFHRAFSWRNLLKLRHLPKVATFKKMSRVVDRYFTDPHLRQLFKRFATYNGSSPYLTPATFNIIPYVEGKFGGWYVRGGMIQIARALEKLAVKKGVKIHFRRMARDWEDGVLKASDGGSAKPDYIVGNGDMLQATRSWLRHLYSEKEKKKLASEPLSCSGFILFLAVNRKYEQLRQHNIFFGDNYPGEFRDIFERGLLPEEPTIYVSITGRSDPAHAPEGCDNYFVLVNSPALGPGTMTEEQVTDYSFRIVERLEKMGLEGLLKHIQFQKAFTAHEFAERDATYRGSLYGWASHSIRTALFRPPVRSPKDRRIFFVGGTTHPGGGVPLVLLSGKIVAEKIARELKK